jgi:hypothetical protein
MKDNKKKVPQLGVYDHIVDFTYAITYMIINCKCIALFYVPICITLTHSIRKHNNTKIKLTIHFNVMLVSFSFYNVLYSVHAIAIRFLLKFSRIYYDSVLVQKSPMTIKSNRKMFDD